MPKADANVGKFMIGLGAIIELKGTGKILILKRESEFQKNTWEIMYGRIDQHEEFEQGLRREIMEETGILDVKFKQLHRMWHIYRGEKSAENELFGFTFICETEDSKVKLSREHSDYKWIEPEKAVELIRVSGIKQDVELYVRRKNDNYQKIEYSSLSEKLTSY